MSEEIIKNKNWWQKNWIWFLSVAILFTLIFCLSLNSNSKQGLISTAKAYTETELYENAIQKANSNQDIIHFFGTIEPLDQLAILEGNTNYSNNYNSVELSVRINGEKRKGKLNISAIKNGKDWEYKKISVRTKNPEKEILIFNDL